MARRIQLIALFLAGTALAAQAEPAAPTTPRPFHLGPKAKQEANRGGPEVENVLKALEALSPEQRQKFQENFMRWVNLPQDEKRTLRERDEARKKKMVEETEAAIQQSGLNLNQNQRGRYAKRYAEGRRAIEEKLRNEMEEKRQPMVKELTAQLKIEFSGGAVATTPAPTP